MTSKLQTLGDSGPQYFCNFCLYGTNDKTEYIDHLHDEEHLTTVKESHKRESVYSCKSCNYITYNKNNYDKHLLSNKHKQLISNHNPQKKMICEFCNIEYSTRQSLWVHKKKCNKQKQTKDNLAPHLLSVGVTPNTPNASASNNASALFNSVVNENLTEDKDPPNTEHHKPNIVMEIESNQSEMNIENNQNVMSVILEKLQNMEQRFQDLKEELKQESSQPQYTRGPYKKKETDKTIDFLNTHCGDAKNISCFMEPLELTNEDYDLINENKTTYTINCFKQKYYKKLDYFKENDFADAMMCMFRDWFGKFDIYDRPIHCTHVKQRIFYIKENNEWIKLEDTDKILRIIRYFERISIISWLIFNNETLSCPNVDDKFFTYIDNLKKNISVSNNYSKQNPLITMICEYFYLSKDILSDI